MTFFFKVVMLGCVIGLMWLWVDPRAQAQSKPFEVYETAGACVYVAGYVNPTIAVIPKTQIPRPVGGC